VSLGALKIEAKRVFVSELVANRVTISDIFLCFCHCCWHNPMWWPSACATVARPKAERAESLTLDVALSPGAAFHGCTVPVGVGVFSACPECNGTGQVFPFRCLGCAGSALFEEQRTLRVRVPPGVRSGTVLEVPLEMFECSGSATFICGCRFRFRMRCDTLRLWVHESHETRRYER
jgi:hypothetical protein